MVRNVNTLSGGFAAVLIGTMFILVPWLSGYPPSFFGKIFINIFGLILIYFGIKS